jgi:anti-anti-sigma factor
MQLDMDTRLVCLEPSGELTLATAAEWHARLLEALASGREVSLDLSRVSRIDLAGLQLIASAQAGFRAAGLSLTLAGQQPVWAPACLEAGIPVAGGSQS